MYLEQYSDLEKVAPLTHSLSVKSHPVITIVLSDLTGGTFSHNTSTNYYLLIIQTILTENQPKETLREYST